MLCISNRVVDAAEVPSAQSSKCPHPHRWRPTKQQVHRKSNLCNANQSHEDLSGEDLTDVVLSGANLSEADLTRANLSGANLSGADLTIANLSEADLSIADLTRADLGGASLSHANLKRANLSEARLGFADLTRADLTQANLTHANLIHANLSGADLLMAKFNDATLFSAILHAAILDHAELSKANLFVTDLSGADLRDAILTQANLRDANLTRADLTHANLTHANLIRANLSGANLSEADLSEADLTRANLTGADLSGANLSGADLSIANITKTQLAYVDLTNTTYRPVSGPPGAYVAGIKGLDTLKLVPNEQIALVQLRKLLQDAGLRNDERKATCSIQRSLTRDQFSSSFWSLGWLWGSLRFVGLDATTAYGLYPWRALIEIMALGFLFTFVYMQPIRQPRKEPWKPSGVYRVFPARRIDKTPSTQTVDKERLDAGNWVNAFGWAAYFSLISAVNIGFQQFTPGDWIRRLQHREYVLEAVGWVRSVAGLQALLSVYLLAIWVLTQFGRPFQ
jgi:uncharacterized protein YjbI with pentapeptide repeats